MMTKATVWVIDYYTADSIFNSNNIALQTLVKTMVSSGSLRYSMIERESFKSKPQLKLTFFDHAPSCVKICSQIADSANAIGKQVLSKKWSRADSSAKFIAATAHAKGFGTISIRQGAFLTLQDLALVLKFPCYDLKQVCKHNSIPFP